MKFRKYDIFQNFRRKSLFENILHCFVSLIFTIVAFSYLYILIWNLISSFKTHGEIIMEPFALPTVFHWENYKDIFSVLRVGDSTFFHMIFNSLAFSVWGTFANLFVSAQFAYVAVKYKFPGSNIITPLIMVIMTLPLYGVGGGTYELYHKLGLIDSYGQLLVFGSVTHSVTLYFMAYFKNLSWSYAEAAMIDGANHFDICYRVMMPHVKPLFGSFFLINWLSAWNDYSSTMIYHPKLPNLAYGIYQFQAEMLYLARLDILAAACVVATIPSLVLFGAFNKQLTESVSLGGLKG